MKIDITKITCIRCKGKGVHEDKQDINGGIIECGLCASRVNGFLESSFEFKQSEYLTRNDDNYLETI